jgi:hypothetical protein
MDAAEIASLVPVEEVVEDEEEEAMDANELTAIEGEEEVAEVLDPVSDIFI